jgi:hypothetical protein
MQKSFLLAPHDREKKVCCLPVFLAANGVVRAVAMAPGIQAGAVAL